MTTSICKDSSQDSLYNESNSDAKDWTEKWVNAQLNEERNKILNQTLKSIAEVSEDNFSQSTIRASNPTIFRKKSNGFGRNKVKILSKIWSEIIFRNLTYTMEMNQSLLVILKKLIKNIQTLNK